MLAYALTLVALAYFAGAGPLPQDSLTHTTMAIPTGPTTVTYTWTYPYTQTKTVIYGGAGWTTYTEYTTIDGSRVVTTIVAPTRIQTVPTATLTAIARPAGPNCGIILAIVVPAIVMIVLGVFFWWRLTKEKRLRREAAVKTKEVKEVDSETSSEASSICEKAEQ